MSSWDVQESTGFLDDADIYIERCRFGYDATYGDAIVFILEGRSPKGNPADDNKVRQFYSIGKDWEVADGGKRVVGKDKFHVSTNYARFFRAVLEIPEAAAALQTKGYPDNATIWEGHAFHFEEQEVDYGKDFGKRRVLLPNAYLGEVAYPGSGGGGAAPAAVDVKAKAAAAKAKAAAQAGGGGGQRGALVALAAKHTDHDEFLAAVYGEFPDIEDSEYFTDILSPEGSIWTEAH